MGPLYNDIKLAIFDCELRFLSESAPCLFIVNLKKKITINKYADHLTKIILKCRL